MDMTLEAVLENAKSWPEEDRSELIEAAREIEARRNGAYVPSDDERAAIQEGLEQARRGEFVEGEALAAFWARMKA